MTKNMPFLLESALDLNSNNIWLFNEMQIAKLWEASKTDEDFQLNEDHVLNVIRMAFEVVHYNHKDIREKKKYEATKGVWRTFSHTDPARGKVAIRKKVVRTIADLCIQNINQISAASLVELLSRNFGCGWESISSVKKEIINSEFDVISTQLPTTRLHAPGGTLEKKIKEGFEVLEIPKGTWTEAIFVRKKIEIDLSELEDEKESQPITAKDKENASDDDDKSTSKKRANLEEVNSEDATDDTFYSSFSEEAVVDSDADSVIANNDEEEEDQVEE